MGTDRWESLFAELEAELAAGQSADLRAEVADRTRREFSSLRLVDRLRPAVGHPLRVELPAGLVVAGRLVDVGADWILVAEQAGSALVPLSHIVSLLGLGAGSAVPGSEGRVTAALDVRHALRRLARDRAPVVLTTVDGGSCFGTLDRVGADFVEIAQHPVGEPRRVAAVHGMRAVPVAAVILVRSG